MGHHFLSLISLVVQLGNDLYLLHRYKQDIVRLCCHGRESSTALHSRNR